MFELHVSYDCGLSYAKELEAETLDELRRRMDELDALFLRWYVAEDGEVYDDAECLIHRELFESIVAFVGGNCGT